MQKILSSRTVQIALSQLIGGFLIIVLTEMDAVGYVAIVKSVMDIIVRLDTTESLK